MKHVKIPDIGTYFHFLPINGVFVSFVGKQRIFYNNKSSAPGIQKCAFQMFLTKKIKHNDIKRVSSYVLFALV